MELWSTLKKSLYLLDKRGRRKFFLAGLIQASLGILDVLGVLLSGVIATIASTSFLHLSKPTLITRMLENLHLSHQDPSNVIILLTVCALGFFLAKTIFALYFTHRTFRFLAAQQSRISMQLVSKVLSSDYVWFRNQDPHVLSQSLVRGVSAATVNGLGNVLLLAGEISLVLLFLLFLIVVKPLIALFMLVYMFLVLYGLNIVVGRRITMYHNNLTALDLQSQMSLFNALKLFREMRVLHRSGWFERNSAQIVTDQARDFADDAWIQQMPKYVLEVALLVGALLLLLAGKFSANPGQLIPIITIYLAGTARIFPSLLRIQSSLISLRSHSALALNAHKLFDTLQMSGGQSPEKAQISLQSPNHNETSKTASLYEENQHINTTLRLTNLGFTYPNAEKRVLRDLSFVINPGERVAIVGPSGAGKSTLCDLLLGLLHPTEGSLEIGEIPAEKWIATHVGKVSYLPQETALISGSVLENICVGLHDWEIDLEKVSLAIERAQLTEFLKGLPQGWNTYMGVGGAKLSGGQKQRIGIARALYSDPKILIMDEATSALDAETEHEVMSVLGALGKQTTVVFIAHRLSSIRNFPRIMYFEKGSLLGDGNFSKLRIDVPRFEKQVTLLGL